MIRRPAENKFADPPQRTLRHFAGLVIGARRRKDALRILLGTKFGAKLYYVYMAALLLCLDIINEQK